VLQDGIQPKGHAASALRQHPPSTSAPGIIGQLHTSSFSTTSGGMSQHNAQVLAQADSAAGYGNSGAQVAARGACDVAWAAPVTPPVTDAQLQQLVGIVADSQQVMLLTGELATADVSARFASFTPASEQQLCGGRSLGSAV
jgi:hypothetical protein